MHPLELPCKVKCTTDEAHSTFIQIGMTEKKILGQDTLFHINFQNITVAYLAE